MVLGYDNMNPIQVSISQFYGIEINDFAVTVARLHYGLLKVR